MRRGGVSQTTNIPDKLCDILVVFFVWRIRQRRAILRHKAKPWSWTLELGICHKHRRATACHVVMISVLGRVNPENVHTEMDDFLGVRNLPTRYDRNFILINFYETIFIHSVICLAADPWTLPKPVLHRVRSTASALKFQYPCFPLRSSSSCIRLICLSVNSMFQKTVPTQTVTNPISLSPWYCM